MLNCILEINTSIIHLHCFCFYSMFPGAWNRKSHVSPKAAFDETIYRGHQVNSLYVYSQQLLGVAGNMERHETPSGVALSY